MEPSPDLDVLEQRYRRFLVDQYARLTFKGISRSGKAIDLVCAGTFGAPTREWVPGYPLQYQLLRFEGNKVTVETRRREDRDGAWKPDARWTAERGKDPAPRYEIPLFAGGGGG